MKKLIVFAIAILGFTAVSFGQDTDNAVTSANIITPISISNTVEMNFGNIAINATDGTVTLPSTAPATRTTTGGVTLPAASGTVTAAQFKVDGESTNTFSISLPTSDFTITKGGGVNMIVNNFSSTPSGTGTLVGGTKTIIVGATLNVSGNQASGLYTNTSGFPVTVNYN